MEKLRERIPKTHGEKERRWQDLIDAVCREAETESASANRLHGRYHSPHEGWAVIREEMKEAVNEAAQAADALGRLDADVRLDRGGMHHRQDAHAIFHFAVHAAAEYIQTAATAMRYMDAVERWEMPWSM